MKTTYLLGILFALAAGSDVQANPFGFSQATNSSSEISSSQIPNAHEVTILKGFFSETNHTLLALLIPSDNKMAPARVPVPVKFNDEQNQVMQLLELFKQGQEQVISLNCQLYLPVKANDIEIQASNIDLGSCIDPTTNGQTL